MSWFKDNKFLAALGGGTLVALVVLFVVGFKATSQYDLAKSDFEAAAQEAAAFERLPLYPKRENLDGKTKALDEYRKAAESLQAAFDRYRPEELQNISPEEFTTRLKAANDEVRKAFDDAGTKVPEPFFCGFEKYKTILAQGKATGILDYQLTGTKNLMLALAASGATEFINLHRPALPEEGALEFKPEPSDVARELPLEITFKGTEQALRKFLSAIVQPDGYYVVLRSLRVTNEKNTPPRTADAKFEKPRSAEAEDAAANPFGGGFVLPEEEPAAVEEPAPAPAPAPAPEAAPADSSRILSQVLGNEELRVFLRLDILQFLPAKKLP